MPGPFPGMDPWLESPANWPEVHKTLSVIISGRLNRSLPGDYVCRMGSAMFADPDGPARPPLMLDRCGPGGWDTGDEVTTAGPAGPERVRTDLRRDGDLPADRTRVGGGYFVVHDPPLRRMIWLEVKRLDGPGGRGRLVTRIELLSHSTKRTGPDRRAYARRREADVAERVNFVEIDLLRSGRRSPIAASIARELTRDGRPFDYLVVTRDVGDGARGEPVFVQPVGLADPLPVVPIPLDIYGAGPSVVPLDLRACFAENWRAGGYDRRGLYRRKPDPPVSAGWSDWAAERVAAWREGREPKIAPPAGDGEADHGAGEEP